MSAYSQVIHLFNLYISAVSNHCDCLGTVNIPSIGKYENDVMLDSSTR